MSLFALRWVVFVAWWRTNLNNLSYMLNWNVYVFGSFLTISKRGKKTFDFIFIDVCPLNLPFSKTAVSGLWAYLAPLCYTLSVPLQLSSELCRKIFLHVLAELCRFSASCSHSADTLLDCPPATTKNHLRTSSEHYGYRYRKLYLTRKDNSVCTVHQHIHNNTAHSEGCASTWHGEKSALLLFVWSATNRQNNMQNKKGYCSISNLDYMRHQKSA